MGLFGGIVGGLAGGIGGFFAGGPAGAIYGASAGYALGDQIEEEIDGPDKSPADKELEQYQAEREETKKEEEKIRAETQAEMEKSLYIGDARDESLMTADRAVRFLEGQIEARNDRALDSERVRLGLVDEPNSDVSSDFEFVAGLLEEETKEDAQDTRESLDEMSTLFNT